MATVTVRPAALRTTKWWEYAERFVFGGLITAVVGIIGKLYGPVVAGLFLAFPSILPCSITLAAKHEQKKHRAEGEQIALERGKSVVSDETSGTMAGSLGLAVFGAVVWFGMGRIPASLVLIAATLMWCAVGMAVWWTATRNK